MGITGRGTRHLLRSAAVRFARPDSHGRGALIAFGALSAVDLLATARARRGGAAPSRAEPARSSGLVAAGAAGASGLLGASGASGGSGASVVDAGSGGAGSSGAAVPAPASSPPASPRPARGLSRSAKPLLMPALASYALRQRADEAAPMPKALVAGLAFGAAGDTALLFDDHEAAFLTGMAAFLGTQVSYTAGMVRLGAVEGVIERPRLAVGCLAGWAAVNALLTPALDRHLRLPVAGYSLAIAAMGAAASGLGGKVAVGALSFIVSDLLIGLQAVGIELPAHEVLVMAGYIAGQYLIATGWLDRLPS